jgi:hypothetical protein
MRSSKTKLFSMRFGAFVTFALACLCCQDSNSVTAPTGTVSPAAGIAGAWSGTFEANDSSCGKSSALATFQQNGANVTGNLKTSTCGVAGYFSGTLQGDTLIGSIKMEGCTGGEVSGIVGAAQISLSVGDLTKPLVTDRPVMIGGIVTLHR